MAKPKPTGTCYLCGAVGPLSFEHIPPEAAFNDKRVLNADIQKVIGKHPEHWKSGKYSQRGAGDFTLCEQCNTTTGGWYGRSYVSLVHQLYGVPLALRPGQTALVTATIQPLFVLKQILVMFVSACGADFVEKRPSLRRYLLNRDNTAFSFPLSVHLGFFDRRNSNAARQSGITTRLDLNGAAVRYSEISFPPFNIVLAVESESPDARLMDITWFRQYAPGEKRDVSLHLCNLAVNSYHPGLYLPAGQPADK